jgi:biopolymer transport protein ExbD
MRFKSSLKEGEAAPNLTPLIDVVLNLLIFFMLSSSFIFQPGINVKLPESEVSETKKEKSFEVILTQENFIFFENQRISLEGLRRKLEIIGRNFPDAVLVLKADENVRHRHVVRILSIAKMNGIKKLGIGTRPVQEPYEE